MARKKATSVFNDSLEVEAALPLDARTKVDTKADLLDPTSFAPYAYEGLVVYVVSEKKSYTLIDATDTTLQASWREVGAGASTPYDDSVLAGRIDDVSDAVDILNGDSTTDGSVAKAIADAIDALIDGAPGTYDTLKEISDYIANDQTAAAAVAEALANKVDKVDGKGLSTYDYNDAEKKRITDLEEAMANAGTSDGTIAVAIAVQNDIGNYKNGDNIDAGTAMEAILRKMLSKTTYPTLTGPSAVLSGPANRLLEYGSTLSATFTVAFARGSISPANGTDGFRSGEAIDYALNGGTPQVGNTFNETVSESNKTFVATVSYGAGSQPKDSDGNDYESPLAAGSVNSNTITFEFVKALWSNAADITQIAKEQLVSASAKVKQFDFPAQTATDAMTFDVPADWTVTAVEALNPLSGQWGPAHTDFTITDTEHDGVAYKRYADNRGVAAGARKVRVKWA